jgi:class 3 adenylate cyclase
VAELAGGTLTFVFSDIEGSTRLVRELGASYGRLLADYQRLLRDAFSAHGGREVDAPGDSFFAAFARPRDAVLGAATAQRALGGHAWPSGVDLRARMGIHTGPAELEGSRYVGVAVHRAARLCAAGNGGQVLVSQATVALLEDEQALPALELHDLGDQRLKDFDRPVRVFRLVGAGLPDDPRPLRGGTPPLPALRAADADREQAVAALREHTAAGRLTLEEFSERAERAYAATTLPDLEEVARDLPAMSAAPVPAERPRRRPKRFTGVVFGNTQRTGRWRLARRGVVFVFFGDADLDLRQAELSGSVASITAFVLFGNIDVYVPEGIEVDLGGLAVIGHRREWGTDLQPHPGTPLLRVRILSLFGTADLWRVPAAWVGRSFREVIKSMRRGAHRELPPGAY